MFAGSRHDVRPKHLQPIHMVKKDRLPAPREVCKTLSLFEALVDRAVVHVAQVHGMFHRHALALEIAPQHVREDQSPAQ